MTQFWKCGRSQGESADCSTFSLGVFAFLLKINIDRSVTMYGFGRPWAATNYWFPSLSNAGPVPMQGRSTALALTLLAIRFPSVWLGLAQKAKRLRDAAQPLWLTLLFFVPFVNILFFAILYLWPSSAVQRSSEGSRKAARLIGLSAEPPKTKAALFAIVATSAATGKSGRTTSFTAFTCACCGTSKETRKRRQNPVQRIRLGRGLVASVGSSRETTSCLHH